MEKEKQEPFDYKKVKQKGKDKFGTGKSLYSEDWCLKFAFPPYFRGLKHFFMPFREHIVLQRKHLKMSQKELAKKIGTCAPIIGHYERHEIKPSIEVAKKIADQLGFTVDYLIGACAKIVIDKKMKKHTEEIEAIPADDKHKVYYLIAMAITCSKTRMAYVK